MQQSRLKNFLIARNLFFLLTEDVEEIKLFLFKLSAFGTGLSSVGETATCSISIGEEENTVSVTGEIMYWLIL